MRKNKTIAYEKYLSTSIDFVLKEADAIFYGNELSYKGSGKLKNTLTKITKKLDEIGVKYALTGGCALILYEYRRFTEDIDILVTKDNLLKIHEKLIGLGYLPVFRGSRGLRDPKTGVRIEFLITGEFPGDGKPKPVAFPNPDAVATEVRSIKIVSLATLIELKLASGMTGGYARANDLKDVYELIKIHKLDKSFVKKLNKYVQKKFIEILNEVRNERLHK